MTDKKREARTRLAVIGAGRWGRNLVRVVRQLGALKYVGEASSEIRAELALQYPDIILTEGLDEVLNDPEVNGVVLATPAATHYQLALRVLASGRHLFVEKPLALSLAEGREIEALARASNLILMVDHLMHGHSAYLRLKQMAERGDFGRIIHIHSRRLSFGSLRTEEDVWWSFAPHDVSMILGLTGREPVEVSVQGDSWVSAGICDAAEARLDFGRGLTAAISVSWLNPVKERRLVVIGDKKSALLDDMLPGPEKLKLFDHRIDYPDGRPLAVSAPAEPVELDESEPLRTQVETFLEAVASKTEPSCNGREGLRVLAVLEAGARSLKSGGRPAKPATAGGGGYFAHPTVEIDEGVTIGAGSNIWHFSHILTGSEIGEKCNIGQNVVIGPRVKIGRGVKIQNNVSVYEGVILEDDVFCGPSMVFTNVINPRSNVNRKDEYRPTPVGRGATIGANATIVCGHRLGEWCFIGAGAVVTKDVPAYALMIGNPARRHGWVCRCGVKLPEGRPEDASALACESCGRTYRLNGESLKLVEQDG